MIPLKIRLQALERDKNTCQICGVTYLVGLHLHHKIPRIKGGKDTLDNLITLCPTCHMILENKYEVMSQPEKGLTFQTNYNKQGKKIIIPVPRYFQNKIYKLKNPLKVIVEEIVESG